MITYNSIKLNCSFFQCECVFEYRSCHRRTIAFPFIRMGNIIISYFINYFFFILQSSVKRKAPTPVVSNMYFGPRLHFAPFSQSLATDNTHRKISILAVICSAKVHCPENTTSHLEKSFPALAPNLRNISLSDQYCIKYKN